MYVAGHLEEYLARKNWVMRCWHGYLFGVKCKWFVHGQAQLLDNSLSLCKYHDDSMTTFYWLCQFSIGVVTLNDNIHSTAATLSLTTIKQSFNISSSLSTQPFTYPLFLLGRWDFGLVFLYELLYLLGQFSFASFLRLSACTIHVMLCLS